MTPATATAPRNITTGHEHHSTGRRLRAIRHTFEHGALDLIEDDGEGPSVKVWDMRKGRRVRFWALTELSDQLYQTLSDEERRLIEGHIPQLTRQDQRGAEEDRAWAEARFDEAAADALAY
jgi:hypothetical protein